jgi:hypothetical protein
VPGRHRLTRAARSPTPGHAGARLLAVALALMSTAVAHGDGAAPIVVRPFSTRCFDAAKLAAQVRARVGDVPVDVGGASGGGRQEVRVAEHAGGISVEVTARDGNGRIVGSSKRIVPADDCATALDIAGLIVARAAMPLNWRDVPEPRPRPKNDRAALEKAAAEKAAEKAAADRAAAEKAAAEKAAAERAATEKAERDAAAQRAAAERERFASETAAAEAEAREARAAAARASRREPGTIVLRMRPPARRWLGELSAAVYGSFGLDGGSDQPGGELAAGFARGRFGAEARGSVDRDYPVAASSEAGPLSLSLRRSTVAVGVHAEVPVRVGAVRFVVGPTLVLWNVRTAGLPHPRSSIIPDFAVDARVFYRLDVGHIFLQAGVDFQVAPTAEDLSITGAGVIAHTPRFVLGPLFALGVNL